MTWSTSKRQGLTTAPEPGVLAAAHCIVRALLAGNGRANVCGSEEELRHRLGQDGSEVNDDDLSEALLLLEENGSPTGYDVGMISGLPHKVVRPESRLQPPG